MRAVLNVENINNFIKYIAENSPFFMSSSAVINGYYEFIRIFFIITFIIMIAILSYLLIKFLKRQYILK